MTPSSRSGPRYAGRELLDAYRRSGVQWLAVSYEDVYEMLEGVVKSGRAFTEAEARVDAHLWVAKGGLKASAYYAKRWKWTLSKAYSFFVREKLLMPVAKTPRPPEAAATTSRSETVENEPKTNFLQRDPEANAKEGQGNANAYPLNLDLKKEAIDPFPPSVFFAETVLANGMAAADFQEAWGELKRHLEYLGKPMTPPQEKALLDELARLPKGLWIPLARQPVLFGWKTFFFELKPMKTYGRPRPKPDGASDFKSSEHLKKRDEDYLHELERDGDNCAAEAVIRQVQRLLTDDESGLSGSGGDVV